jgi:cysteine desulfurase
MKRIYLDWASSNPVHPKVARAMYVALEDISGNPSASHAEGRRALAAVTDARVLVARSLSVKPEEILFTSGGTESNNIAVRGLVEALIERGAKYTGMHIITSVTEHSSVIETMKLVEKQGVQVTYLTPTFDGLISVQAIVDALRPETILVSLAHVNSETGVVNQIADIAHGIRKWKENRRSTFISLVPEFAFPVLHTDAAQSPMYLESSPHALLADLVSYDAQKLMGPKGVGVLFRDFSIPLSPVSGGGVQERKLRPGTENVPAIVGAGIAFTLAKEGRTAREERVRGLRDYLISEVEKKIPEAKLIGHPTRRIANNALFAISGVSGDYLAVLMDKEGIAITPRSACVGSGGGFSHVVKALTGDMALAEGTIRFSLGPMTEEGDINQALRAFVRVIPLARLKV